MVGGVCVEFQTRGCAVATTFVCFESEQLPAGKVIDGETIFESRFCGTSDAIG